MFLIVLFILAALAFPPCLITAITLRIKDDERAIRYTIASSLFRRNSFSLWIRDVLFRLILTVRPFCG